MTKSLKIYNACGEHIASCTYAVDAAAIMSATQREGATIRYGHKHVVWEEGKEEFAAWWDYRGVARLVNKRIEELILKRRVMINLKEVSFLSGRS